MSDSDLTGLAMLFMILMMGWLAYDKIYPFFRSKTSPDYVDYYPEETEPETMPITLDNRPQLSPDTRENTLLELARIAEFDSIKPFEFSWTLRSKAVPFLADGSAKWHHFQPGLDGHWGIFGTSGSGKGNLLQHIALHSLALGPARIDLTIIDAKGGLDYAFCNKIQHAKLYANETMSEGLDAILKEMRRRIILLGETECRNIQEFNSRYPEQAMPYQLVIADEIADFSRVERDLIATFARMSRAAGGVLFVATQYPTVDVLPSQIQANVTNRVVFRLPSSEYVRVALRRQKDDGAVYDPFLISKAMPGAAVWRSDAGQEVLGRVPENSEVWRSQAIRELASQFPKAVPGTGSGSSEFKIAENYLEPVPDNQTESASEIDVIRALVKDNWSGNRIYGYLGGRRSDVLEKVRQVREELKNAKVV